MDFNFLDSPSVNDNHFFLQNDDDEFERVQNLQQQRQQEEIDNEREQIRQREEQDLYQQQQLIRRGIEIEEIMKLINQDFVNKNYDILRRLVEEQQIEQFQQQRDERAMFRDKELVNRLQDIPGFYDHMGNIDFEAIEEYHQSEIAHLMRERDDGMIDQNQYNVLKKIAVREQYVNGVDDMD